MLTPSRIYAPFSPTTQYGDKFSFRKNPSHFSGFREPTLAERIFNAGKQIGSRQEADKSPLSTITNNPFSSKSTREAPRLSGKAQKEPKSHLSWFIIRGIEEPERFKNSIKCLNTCKRLFENLERAIYSNGVIRVAIDGQEEEGTPKNLKSFHKEMGKEAAVERSTNRHRLFAIYGVPTCITPTEIGDDAEKKGIKIKVVRVLFPEKEKSTILIEARDKNSNSALKRTKKHYIGSMRHDVRQFIDNNPTRCFKCQRFGHLARVCTFKARCPKCSEDHDEINCENNSINCANCNEKHCASDKKCPEFVKLKKKKEKGKITKRDKKRRGRFGNLRDLGKEEEEEIEAEPEVATTKEKENFKAKRREQEAIRGKERPDESLHEQLKIGHTPNRESKREIIDEDTMEKIMKSVFAKTMPIIQKIIKESVSEICAPILNNGGRKEKIEAKMYF